ncbi:MAG: hypothetical protein KAT68_13245 [Bacteroidales bacterium]|nr:hypothetical protein [Bacteroidales bacterium]
MENTNQTNIVGPVQTLPNSSGVLILGILSIAACWCYGLISVALGIIALVLASKGRKLYFDNPDLYTPASYKNLSAGRVCAIIGLCLSGVYVLALIIYLIIVGAAIGTIFSTMPWENFL